MEKSHPDSDVEVWVLPALQLLLAAIGKSRKQVKFCNSPRLPCLRASKKTIPSYAVIAVNITLPT
jgi:hypothetical protein